MRVCDSIAAQLRQLGVENVFGLLGSGNFGLGVSLRHEGIRYVSARHEENALCMADAYARARRRVGVCSLHQGPGLTNSLTALAEAVKARTPVLVIAAEVPEDDLFSNFRIDQTAVVKSLGAHADRVRGGLSAAADLTRAFRRAQSERTVVVLMIPSTLERAELPEGVPERPVPPVSELPPRPSRAAVDQAVALVSEADRPVIIGGRGAVLSGAGQAIQELGDRIGALFATSALAHGLFAGSPYDLGISGGFSTPFAMEVIPEADLIVSFGAGLNDWTTRDGAMIGAGTRIIQVDRDPAALGRYLEIDLGIVADAAETARDLTEAVSGMSPGRGFRAGGISDRIAAAAWRNQPFDPAGAEGFIDGRILTRALDDLVPLEGRIVVPDSGHFMIYPPRYLAVPDADGFLFTQSFMSIGLGLATAIGAQIAHPDRLAMALLGDGGALMGLSEFETLARLNLPLLVVVYNDAAYGAEVHHMAGAGFTDEEIDIVRFDESDLAGVAKALGMDAITVRSEGDLAPVADWAANRTGPLVIDAKIDRTLPDDWMHDIPHGRRDRAREVGI